MLFDLNKNVDVFESVIQNVEVEIGRKTYPDHLLWLRNFVFEKLNINDSSMRNISLYIPDGTNQNQDTAFKDAHLWLNHRMSDETKMYHFRLMENIMYTALTKLHKSYPEIAKDANKLTSQSAQLKSDTFAKYREKLFTHQDDLFPEELYPELNLPLNSKKEIAHDRINTTRLLLLLIEQILLFIDHPETIKKFGFTITNKTIQYENENYQIPWYKPVILCIHEPSSFCCMLDINNLAKDGPGKFTSSYALDDYQTKSCELFRFICPRQGQARTFDDIVSYTNFETIIDKTADLNNIYLPPSFIEFRNTPEYENYCQYVKNRQER